MAHHGRIIFTNIFGRKRSRLHLQNICNPSVFAELEKLKDSAVVAAAFFVGSSSQHVSLQTASTFGRITTHR